MHCKLAFLHNVCQILDIVTLNMIGQIEFNKGLCEPIIPHSSKIVFVDNIHYNNKESITEL